MKTILMLALAGSTLFADTVTFGTVPGSDQTNNVDGINYPTAIPSAYFVPVGASVWESTQPDSTNPQIPDGYEAIFSFEFSLGSAPLSGILTVGADDAAIVAVNGFVIANDLSSSAATNCAAELPNCLTPDSLDITSDLGIGSNIVSVTVEQLWGGWFAVDAFGVIQTVPEPGSLVLLGLGLIAVGWRGKGR
jgi:hypothetical protein